MAASATMGSTAGLTTRLTASRIHLSAPIFLLPSRRPLRVRCQAEDQQQSPIPKPIQKKVNFNDLLAFRGPAPERINGRLAMVGFVSALAVEAALGDDLFAQLAHGGVPLFLGTAALLSAASLVPLFKGVSPQSRSDGLMTADAEMWNGRFAMLGLVALAFTEYLKGGPLV